MDPAPAAYAFVARDSVTLHLSGVDEHPENADALFAEWSSAGVEGRLSAPVDTPWGMREGNYIDPDGLLFRFRSPQ